MIFGMGMMELGMTFSYSQLIIDDWIVGEIKNIFGVKTGKQFIWPELARVSNIDHEKSDIAAKAWYKSKAILAHHKPLAVSDSVKRKFQQIIAEANDQKAGSQGGDCGDKSKRFYAKEPILSECF